MLELLLERERDKSAYTRSAACRAWESLAQRGAGGCAKIPISHWLPVTELAVGASHSPHHSASVLSPASAADLIIMLTGECKVAPTPPPSAAGNWFLY